MDLEELRGFLAVADSGSFLAAATECGVPRATLRRRIDALEARVGVALLERNARGVTLTEAGETLLARGRKLVDEGAALLATVRAAAQPNEIPLRLRVPVGLPPEAFINFVQLARAVAPARRLQVLVCEDPLAQLDALDVALVLGEVDPPKGWLLRLLRRVQIRAVASPRYLERRGRPQTLADLHTHDLAAWSGPQLDPCAWPLRTEPLTRVELRPSLITNDIHALHELAAAGLAITLLPDARLDLLSIVDLDLQPVLPELIGAELEVHVAIAEASSEREHIERATDLISELSRETN